MFPSLDHALLFISVYEASVVHRSIDVLEHILSHENCDVDPVNRIDGATPLHLALYIQEAELRLHIFESLLDAGADMSCVLLLHHKPYSEFLFFFFQFGLSA